MITRLKRRIKESLTFSRFKKVDFNGLILYQDARKDYNGLYRLLSDIKAQCSGMPISLHAKSYYVIAGGICSLGNEEALFANVDFERLPCPNIIIDVSTEAINFQLENDFYLNNFRKLFVFIKKDKYQKFHFTIIHANSANNNRLSSILSDLGLNSGKISVIGIDFYLARLYLDMNKTNLFNKTKGQVSFDLNRSRIYYEGRYFLCMNHRPRWHRYAIVLSLIDNNLLNKGYVSFAGDQEGRVDAPTVDSLAEAADILSKHKDGAVWLSHLESLNKMTPLMLDRSPSVIQTELWGKEATGTLTQPLMLDESIPGGGNRFNLCYFEIVTETYFTDAHCSYLTEKTLRPIIMRRPFIHVGTPFMLKKLKHYGFKTFSGFIDESYDEIEDQNDRLSAVLKEINRLCSMGRDQIDEGYRKLEAVLNFNQEHFKNNANEILGSVISVII